jgi:hypothetical protein
MKVKPNSFGTRKRTKDDRMRKEEGDAIESDEQKKTKKMTKKMKKRRRRG